MGTDLLRHVLEALVLPDALEGLAQQRVEGLVAGPGVAGAVGGNGEGGHPEHPGQRRSDSAIKETWCWVRVRPVEGRGGGHGLVHKLTVLQLLTQPLCSV